MTPDILVGGKGLASGYAPMGGIFASESVVAPVIEQGQEFMFFTYSAHPASCPTTSPASRPPPERKEPTHGESP